MEFEKTNHDKPYLYKILKGDWAGYKGALVKLATSGESLLLNIYKTSPNEALVTRWIDIDDVEMMEVFSLEQKTILQYAETHLNSTIDKLNDNLVFGNPSPFQQEKFEEKLKKHEKELSEIQKMIREIG